MPLGNAEAKPPGSSQDSCPAAIKFDGKVGTDKPFAVLPGQKITVEFICKEGKPDDIQWEVPDIAFKEYILSTQKGALTTLASYVEHTDKNYLKRPKIDFYWADCGTDDKGATKVIKAKAVLGHRTCEAAATFHVVRPECDFRTVHIGEVKLNGTGNFAQLLPKAGTNQGSGIKFEGKVYFVPSSAFPRGRWAFVRTVDDDMATKFSIGGAELCRTSKYPGEFVADSNQPRTEGNTGDTFNDVDSPGLAVVDAHAVYSRSCPLFREYVMFKPKDGEWVPLKVIRWWAFACAEGTTLSGKVDAGADQPIVTGTHPEWSHFVTETDTTKDGDCPADPGCANWKPRVQE